MNRPSRTEDDLEHPTWNQNPPFLAPDLTTRQDLNGIANAREHRHGCSNNCISLSLLNGEKRAGDAGLCDCKRTPARPLFRNEPEVRLPAHCPQTTAPGGEGQACRSPRPVPPPPRLDRLDRVGHCTVDADQPRGEPSPALWADTPATRPPPQPASPPPTSPPPQSPPRQLLTPAKPPPNLRQHPLPNTSYNTPLHVGALLIILSVSSLACAVPLLASKFPVLRIPEPFLFGVRHFGTGVLLATAFVHLLPTAFISLGNPCLSSFWTTDYPAMPGAIAGLTEEQMHKKAILQCMLLEVGILFHSVFIGMALSVSVGTDFVVLLIAVAFHQTFEGLALGARIASISWPKNTMQPWLMVLAYGCTTPIGQAIGLATHTLYSPDSEFGLILVGTMNAMSSGLLVFAALIELLAEDFLSDQSWVILRGKKRVVACFLVLFGAICMSLVGAWA
ncbi:hypothetical protein N0V88_007651 [Collariella sp. IMI 366227]|nr:hypothetical protein N0V88_007651 [Collariella sp. IMI 366227]